MINIDKKIKKCIYKEKESYLGPSLQQIKAHLQRYIFIVPPIFTQLCSFLFIENYRAVFTFLTFSKKAHIYF